MTRRIRLSPGISVVAMLAAALVWGCSDQSGDPTSALEGPIAPTVLQRDLAMVMKVQERHTPELMRVANVVGTAVSLGADGEPVVTVLARAADLGRTPKVLEGVPVEVLVTGEFRAGPPFMAQPRCEQPPCGRPGGGGGGGDVDLTARFDRPVPIGISTGHPAVTAGTIGARVRDGQGVYALSNNHVYAVENLATQGDAVIQPGTYDGGSSPADDIGNLARWQHLVFSTPPYTCINVIDAALASTTTDQLGNSTPPGVGYGTPRSTTVLPALNMKVKKVGRTTGFTKGTIQAINATVAVGYSNGNVACFIGQIITTNMSAGGDSGSLVVVDGKGQSRADDRKPVGLLFAGSPTATVLNPIDPVLITLGVTIDGD
jgi:hypothetical protein